MHTRTLGRTGLEVSEVGLGAWAIGGDWGEVSETDAMATLHAAVDAGVTLIDTADVYGDGRSERLVGQLLRDRPEVDLVVATKAGRRLDPHEASGYDRTNLETFVDRSLTNLGVDQLDLVQLHCPPWETYYQRSTYEAMEAITAAGKVAHWGVSVEKVEEALKAITHPVVETVQVIFNAFRQRPAELLFREAAARDVGILARVPLASGLLTGKMSAETTFAEDDHRNFNADGEAFDVGETFAGVPFEVGLEAVERIRAILGDGADTDAMVSFALRWILSFDAVSTVIPGAKRPEQAMANAAVSGEGPLRGDHLPRVKAVYDELIAPHVHHRW
ncbi:aldo/keto reductase [Euzebya tangerina]|uniref:aldo/keto reductase n=1 Tax=Euzebya tangerina TaxID=591198 RepID=UPI000E31B9F8|nr:aldo/keto reductase [Euzebya tangerina]